MTTFKTTALACAGLSLLAGGTVQAAAEPQNSTTDSQNRKPSSAKASHRSEHIHVHADPHSYAATTRAFSSLNESSGIPKVVVI